METVKHVPCGTELRWKRRGGIDGGPGSQTAPYCEACDCFPATDAMSKQGTIVAVRRGAPTNVRSVHVGWAVVTLADAFAAKEPLLLA